MLPLGLAVVRALILRDLLVVDRVKDQPAVPRHREFVEEAVQGLRLVDQVLGFGIWKRVLSPDFIVHSHDVILHRPRHKAVGPQSTSEVRRSVLAESL
jgi:hypothetical protein